ncbi:iron ABC transporter membrane-spanning permease [Streptococcus pneumoniae]|nr:iron ABC transporter membrane-spanning permease [Streptococcus pneumoniae]CGG50806.1 iron ABC transporter membrane-spanning permease [Streptococcus pneumoniae]CIO50084.1 iron ABC transporter membrane-spanning permease [Streptococcus pneumoniae]CIR02047.1 iron ABC transporter membrane-spanning permease [Streptococcus pneumoniae]CIT08371.1 iron ABC transporter membrane-spanning permease [Streptococcus pneumoniae]
MECKKLNIWTASSFFLFLTYPIFLVYPIVTVLKQALIHEGQFSLANFVTFFSKAYYSETLVNSFRVSITATVTSLVVGTLLAYLFSMYDFKGKKFLQILIIIASMSAPFVGAYSWILLLGRNEVITKFLTNALYLPAIDIYGFKGIVLVFTLQLFPLVFLYVAGTMNSIDNSLLEAAESMGSFGFKPIVTVVLPLLVPTLLAAPCLYL